MSHYDIDYSGLKTVEDKEQKALADVKHWLGTRLFNKKAKLFMALFGEGEIKNWHTFCFGMGMMGVQGYWPCRAFAIHCGFWDSLSERPTQE
jgi:hypothetical protein